MLLQWKLFFTLSAQLSILFGFGREEQHFFRHSPFNGKLKVLHKNRMLNNFEVNEEWRWKVNIFGKNCCWVWFLFRFFFHLLLSFTVLWSSHTSLFISDWVKESGSRAKVVEIGLIFSLSKPFILIDLNWYRIKSSAFHLSFKRFARTFMYICEATHDLQFAISIYTSSVRH